MYFLGLPIDLWVMLLEPGVSQYHTLFPKLSHCKLSAFCMILILEDHIGNLSDCPCLVWGTIYIKYWNWSSESPSWDLVILNPLGVHKQTGGTTVKERVRGPLHSSVSGFYLHLHL